MLPSEGERRRVCAYDLFLQINGESFYSFQETARIAAVEKKSTALCRNHIDRVKRSLREVRSNMPLYVVGWKAPEDTYVERGV